MSVVVALATIRPITRNVQVAESRFNVSDKNDHYGGLVVAAYVIGVFILMVLFILAMVWLAGLG